MTLTELLHTSARVVAFTGAGISTDSGIPDFRSPGGVWTRHDPARFTFERYVASADVRRQSWQMRREFLGDGHEPNGAHRALADLELAGRLLGVITQNIDGLHQAAGSRRVLEIHGTAREVMCIGSTPTHGRPAGCGFRAAPAWAFERIDAGDDDPRCPQCTGLVKSATVSFGQVLFPTVMDECVALVQQADLLIAIGSSLVVQPAAGLPLLGIRHGARLVIINNEPTPHDAVADLVLRAGAAQSLEPAVDALLTGS